MTKNMMLKALSEYMQAKNIDTISLSDYKADENAPVRDYLLRRKYGSWNRVLSVMNKRYPVSVAPVEVEKPKAAPKVEKKAEVKVESKDGE